MEVALDKKHGLVRALGFWATASLLVCNVVGQGIFLKARAITCDVGSPMTVLAVWVLAGLLALCGALTLSELAAMMPESGGPFVYLRRALGRPLAFAYGWMMFFLGAPLAAGALAAGGAIFLNLLSGGALERIRLPLGIAHVSLSGTVLVSLLMILAIALVNLAKVYTNGLIATVLAVVKISMLVLLTGGAFLLGNGSFAHLTMSGAGGSCAGIAAATRGGTLGFAAAIVSALYAYNGWLTPTLMAGEVKAPGRNLPLALGAGMLAIIVLYTAANAAYFYVLSPLGVANTSATSSVGLEVLGHVFGPQAQGVATALIFISVLATLHVTILSTSRISYAVAEDTSALAWLARVSPSSHVPARSVVTGSVLAALFVLVGSFDTLSDFEVFSVWIFYLLSAISLFVLRRREPDAQRPYRVLGYPLIPIVFVASAAWLLLQAGFGAPARSLIGLAIIALAFPVFALLHRREPAR
ncbi:MAG TPA: amino acid permease [Candidatus Acidoferrales bacterium]|nr:amino acid permease [Candidatus Acidoferrales bacterium]